MTRSSLCDASQESSSGYFKNDQKTKEQERSKEKERVEDAIFPLEEKESYAFQKEEVSRMSVNLNPPLTQKPIARFVKTPYLCTGYWKWRCARHFCATVVQKLREGLSAIAEQ